MLKEKKSLLKPKFQIKGFNLIIRNAYGLKEEIAIKLNAFTLELCQINNTSVNNKTDEFIDAS